ncbi:MAG: PQQ-dependent sugar dehydrogenase [Gemmatimonadales bacterium]|nr:PQQ-dependent sugar dehydrogenase [Gemmatimonadales bacterium]
MTRFLPIVLALAFAIAPRPAQAGGLATVRVASGLSGPVFVTSPPGDAQRLFIVEFNTGRIKILKSGSVLATPFLDIGSLVTNNSNFGFLGMTFHPNYASNGYFYVQYVDNSLQPTVARYAVSGNPDVADSGSAQIILTLSAIVDHQGGTVAFGPDGYLYAAFGDGQATDPSNQAQDDGNLHGKMLRLDVDGGTPYAIPATNPFVGAGNPLDEIWAKGFRNPFRFTFDRLTGDLYIADVGQTAREEIDFQPAASAGGENYGWRLKEGTVCYNPSSGCDPGGLTDPIYEYDHSAGDCSVSGGSVYRGTGIPVLAQGTYFFGDWCTGRVWSFRYTGGMVTNFLDRTSELAPGGGLSIDQVVHIGEDGAGELYIVDMDGEIYQIVSDAVVPALGLPGAVAFMLMALGTALVWRRRSRMARAVAGKGGALGGS